MYIYIYIYPGPGYTPNEHDSLKPLGFRDFFFDKFISKSANKNPNINLPRIILSSLNPHICVCVCLALGYPYNVKKI